ncbi:hypothetical protein NEISICOT_03004 [Neisseria sicca ATCC 29256]|uniref:Uncharacterized protein n=1 Tax=Neisseria sicca ATCC 29256 TaxID=547045 RepID=C6M8X9_NEISI|nr:hypothetical protein NEISICOT_03004 [Neisseria sicca ATCC 29256]
MSDKNEKGRLKIFSDDLFHNMQTSACEISNGLNLKRTTTVKTVRGEQNPSFNSVHYTLLI